MQRGIQRPGNGAQLGDAQVRRVIVEAVTGNGPLGVIAGRYTVEVGVVAAVIAVEAVRNAHVVEQNVAMGVVREAGVLVFLGIRAEGDLHTLAGQFALGQRAHAGQNFGQTLLGLPL